MTLLGSFRDYVDFDTSCCRISSLVRGIGLQRSVFTETSCTHPFGADSVCFHSLEHGNRTVHGQMPVRGMLCTCLCSCDSHIICMPCDNTIEIFAFFRV